MTMKNVPDAIERSKRDSNAQRREDDQKYEAHSAGEPRKGKRRGASSGQPPPTIIDELHSLKGHIIHCNIFFGHFQRLEAGALVSDRFRASLWSRRVVQAP